MVWVNLPYIPSITLLISTHGITLLLLLKLKKCAKFVCQWTKLPKDNVCMYMLMGHKNKFTPW